MAGLLDFLQQQPGFMPGVGMLGSVPLWQNATQFPGEAPPLAPPVNVPTQPVVGPNQPQLPPNAQPAQGMAFGSLAPQVQQPQGSPLQSMTKGTPLSGVADWMAARPATLMSLAAGFAGAPSFGDGMRRAFSNAAGGMAFDQMSGNQNLAQQQTAASQNQTYNWLTQQQGMDPQQALTLLGNKPALNDYMKNNVGGPEYRPLSAQDRATYGIGADDARPWQIGRDGKLSLPANAGSGAGGGEYGLNPVWGTDAQGNPSLVQLGKDGKPVQPKLPDGFNIARDPVKVDAGTEWILLDPQTRQPVGRIPKDSAGEQRDKATGKAQGEAQAALPGALQQADTMLGMINDLKTDKRREGSTGGFDHFFNALPGTDGYGYQQKVNQVQGQAFLQAYQSLKGTGSISEAEGKKAEQAIARLSTAQSDGDFLQALNDLEGVVKAGAQKARAQAGGASGGGGGAASTVVPPQAVQALRQNPALRDQFEAKYGPGSAARAMGQ